MTTYVTKYKGYPIRDAEAREQLNSQSEQLNNIANQIGVDEQGNFTSLQTVAQTIIGALNELKNSQATGSGLDLSSLTITTESVTEGTKLTLTDGATTKEVNIPSATEIQVKNQIKQLYDEGNIKIDESVIYNNGDIIVLPLDIFTYYENYTVASAGDLSTYANYCVYEIDKETLLNYTDFNLQSLGIENTAKGTTKVDVLDSEGNSLYFDTIFYTYYNGIKYTFPKLNSLNWDKLRICTHKDNTAIKLYGSSNEYCFYKDFFYKYKDNVIQYGKKLYMGTNGFRERVDDFHSFRHITINDECYNLLRNLTYLISNTVTLNKGWYYIESDESILYYFKSENISQKSLNWINKSIINITEDNTKLQVILKQNYGLNNLYDNLFNITEGRFNSFRIFKFSDKYELENSRCKHTRIIGHRKNRKSQYETSYYYRCNGVEVDIKATQDGILILEHNTSITLNGVSYAIAETDYATLLEASNNDISTLEECLIYCKQHNMLCYLHGAIAANFDTVKKLVNSLGINDLVTYCIGSRPEGENDIRIAYYNMNDNVYQEMLANPTRSFMYIHSPDAESYISQYPGLSYESWSEQLTKELVNNPYMSGMTFDTFVLLEDLE